VFNDGAFEQVTGKANRDSMLIPLVHGEPIRFGAEQERGVMMGNDGRVRLVDVADVGEANLLVHDQTDAGLAFQLSRLSHGPYEPTPIGVFRDIDRPEYADMVGQQLLAAAEQKGPGDLHDLLHSGATWTVD
jgi:2-oxoglutarate ferredoxin oxidoreductase subunit beta